MLIGMSILSSLLSTISSAASNVILTVAPAPSSALAHARLLAANMPARQNASVAGGETEDHQWWVDNAELFEAARKEYGVLHGSLYDFEAHVSDFIQPAVLAAVEACERAAAEGGPIDEAALQALLTPAGAPNVWKIPLLTERFCQLILEELRHYEASGIPLRRPNGMNRYGLVLNQLGLEPLISELQKRYVTESPRA